MVKSIYLQDGEEIFVDDEDYERVIERTWYKYYTNNTRHIYSGGQSLANFLVEGSFQKEKNNYFTKDNLTNKTKPARWKRANSKSKSKYKGVNLNKNDHKWWAAIYLDGKNKLLGRFSTEDEAGKAYNRGVEKYYDGQGYMNKIGYDNRVPIRDYEVFENQKKKRKGVSGYKGVTYRKNEQIYSGRITFSGKRCTFIYNVNKHKVALAYNKCALYLFGKNTFLNDVSMTEELKGFISNWEIPEKIKALKEGANNE